MSELLFGSMPNFVYQDILENISEGVNVVNTRGELLYVNKASALYVYSEQDKMTGKHISTYYPQAAVLNVLKTGKKEINKKIKHSDGEIYIVNAYPLIINKEIKGAFAIFKDITEVEYLNNQISDLTMKRNFKKTDDIFSEIIGTDCVLRETILKAQKAVGALGGPRHSIISGESGTGKTMLAKKIYAYAKKVGVLDIDAPFIEVNCAQFTNADIAAMEVFGSEEGAYTGAKKKKGLFEIANGGILFLDEAHALDHYQNILLKAIETGKIKRIGGNNEIRTNVIIIAASTKNLKRVLLPELYQRLAQYELYLPPLRNRSITERKQLLDYFTRKYQEEAKKRYKIKLEIIYTKEAEKYILSKDYPGNIRQFRDVVNASIDASVPLVDDIVESESINTIINIHNLATNFVEKDIFSDKELEDYKGLKKSNVSIESMDEIILELNQKEGLGPRKIAKVLNEKGYDYKYYQIAYRLKKIKEKSIC